MVTLDTKRVDKAWEEEETEGAACVVGWFMRVLGTPHRAL